MDGLTPEATEHLKSLLDPETCEGYRDGYPFVVLRLTSGCRLCQEIVEWLRSL